jgi:hypothetical protein
MDQDEKSPNGVLHTNTPPTEGILDFFQILGASVPLQRTHLKFNEEPIFFTGIIIAIYLAKANLWTVVSCRT